MKRNSCTTLLALLLGLVGSLLSGCDESHTRLSSLLSNPNVFVNRNVRVIGEVTQVHELPLGLTNLAVYRINDGTGQVWVLSRAGAPLVGDRVGLQGMVRPVGAFNLPILGNILGNVIEEQQRRMR